MTVRWLDQIGADDVATAGGKGASLGELAGAGLPVPPGFVVTADTYRSFIEETGLEEAVEAALEVDIEDDAALEAAARECRDAIHAAGFPDRVRTELLEAYDELDGEFVAARSSATTEDLPDASFAGQQETLLNVTREGLIDAVRECWASLYTARAVYYREQQGFGQDSDIAVVVQSMVDAEQSGVMFTRHPSTGAPETVVEAALGLGEGVVSGSVSPDNYVVREDGIEATVAHQETMFVRDAETGETVEQPVPESRRSARVLEDDELETLDDIGARVENHYGAPQDVEWAIADDEFYLLQSRPITTLAEEKGEDLVSGIGASPGTAEGLVRVVDRLDQLERVGSGDVLVAETTSPDMIAAMQRAEAVVTDRGGMTSHAAIVARELGVPAVVGTEGATQRLEDDRRVAVDGDRGVVTPGGDTGGDSEESAVAAPETDVDTQPVPATGTAVKVNVSIPAAAERAAATGADGVGLLRLEHMVLSTNTTPAKYVADNGEEPYVEMLVEGVGAYTEAFHPRPVRVRTLDAPTDEFRQLEGGDDEPHEPNPMLGYRGFRRSVTEPELFELELEAFARLYEEGYDNLEVMVPLVADGDDARRARELFETAGIDTGERTWGTMIETPASALVVEDILDAGVDFVSFGTNDLTQYTLAVDRNNERVADRYNPLHPAVVGLLEDCIAACEGRDVRTSICGQAGSNPEMVERLVSAGIDSVSVDIDAVADVRRCVDRVERRLLLSAAREQNG